MGGLINQSDVTQLRPDEAFITVAQGKMCVVWPTFDNKFMWYLPVKMKQEDLCVGNEKKQLQQICHDWNNEVMSIINASSQSKRFHLPIHTLQPLKTWCQNRITLMGDAAHAIGPILGQGGSQAIEDAYVLFQCLMKTPNNIPQALKQYQQLLYDKSLRLLDLENQSAAGLIHEDDDQLKLFQEQIKGLSLASFYQDLIPWVDEKSCMDLAKKISFPIQ